MNARMTPRQRRFVTEYVVDFNARQAAIRAGYAAKGAAHQAWQLLNWRPNVADAVREAMKARETRTLITADKALQELARIAFSDIRRLLETAPDGRIRPKPIESLSEADAAAIAELSVTEKGMRIRARRAPRHRPPPRPRRQADQQPAGPARQGRTPGARGAAPQAGADGGRAGVRHA